MHSKAELERNVGKRVSVVGLYGVEESGEHVRNGDVDVMLDIPQEFFGWGRLGVPDGAQVRASGVVQRGAMSLGVFIDERTMSYRHDAAHRPLVPGFVLRDAKVKQLEQPPPPAAAASDGETAK
jgi:hypothetical protein